MNQLCVVVTGSAIRATSVLRLFNDYNKLRLSDLTTNQVVSRSKPVPDISSTAQCPYMDSSSFASKLIWQAWHDCIRISGLIRWHALMPGHNGLFARQPPIALSYFEYLDIPGFSRRRSHLFAIIQFA